MLKSRLHKAISILLAVVMLAFVFSACGGSEPQGSTGEAASQASSSASGEPAANEPVALNVFIDHTWYWTDKFEGIIPEEITKQTGVVLNPTRATDNMQLGVMIASGDLPDLVYTSQLFDRMSDPKVSYSWSELIKQYAPDFKVDPTQETIAKSYSADGDFYTVLNAFSSEEDWHNAKAGCPTLGTLMYRQDIVDELGTGPIKTLDDYVAAMEKVKAKYPDMTPLVLEYSFPLDVFKTWLIPGWLPITSGLMQTADNKIIHYTSTPEYPAFLKTINDWYRKGFISADNFTFTDGSQAEQLAQNNKAFSYTFCTGDANSGFTEETKKNGFEKALWVQSQPLVAGAQYYTVGTGWAGVFITKNNSNPEKSIKLMQWMFSEAGQKLTQWGREGADYTMGADGIPVFSEDWIAARNDEKLFYTKYNPAYYFGISAVTEAVGRASGTSQNAKDVMDTIRANLHLVTAPALVEPKGDSNEKVTLDQIVEFVKNQEIKVILSKSDEQFQTNLNEMTQNLEKMGVKQLEDTLTKAAEKYK